MESPGRRAATAFATLARAVVSLSPLLVSLPVVLDTKTVRFRAVRAAAAVGAMLLAASRESDTQEASEATASRGLVRMPPVG